MLWDVAERIDRRDKLQKIAIRGLNIESHIVQRHPINHPMDITTAAHNVLLHWRKHYEDSTEANTVLCDALTKCKCYEDSSKVYTVLCDAFRLVNM